MSTIKLSFMNVYNNFITTAKIVNTFIYLFILSITVPTAKFKSPQPNKKKFPEKLLVNLTWNKKQSFINSLSYRHFHWTSISLSYTEPFHCFFSIQRFINCHSELDKVSINNSYLYEFFLSKIISQRETDKSPEHKFSSSICFFDFNFK